MQIDTILLAFFFRIALTIIVGLPVLFIAARALRNLLKNHLSIHISTLISNILLYIGFTLLGISILHDLGFNISALLGAAGIIGIAISFAAQTSVSNLISGIFLLLEGSCAIGDSIECDNTSGIIESIDLISVKIRTPHNTFVRIPNEFFIKKMVVNKTYYDTYAISFILSFPFEEDKDTIIRLVQEFISTHAIFLSHPAPKIALLRVFQSSTGCTDTSFYLMNEIQVDVWVKKGTHTQARDLFIDQMQKKLYVSKIKVAINRI